MALIINDLCITCDVCLAPCPNKAITAGDEICINYNGEPDDASPVWFEEEDEDD